MTENLIIEEIPQETSKQILPMSYVVWLTMRSKFIDEYGKRNPDFLNEWKAYESEQIDQLTLEMEGLS